MPPTGFNSKAFKLGEDYITQNTITDFSFSYRRLYESQTFVASESPALSVSLPFIAGGGTTTQTMPTTITGGVPPYTLVSWVKNSGSGVFGGTSVNSAVVNKQISVNTNFVCTVTIRDSVFTQASGSGTINWLIA